ncbi:MAG: hypothetical protein SFT81_02965 [Candidatus Caenarcaniphilales bacterium]|nr:hypothetical protein [Candidatus Caenarcaniphilales bacterium]
MGVRVGGVGVRVGRVCEMLGSGVMFVGIVVLTGGEDIGLQTGHF